MKINWLWDTRLSEKDVKKILHDEENPRFYIYATKLFSRVNEPKAAFEYIDKQTFCRKWPMIKKRVQKDAWTADRADFWQTMYERTAEELKENGFKIRQPSKSQIPSERLSIAEQIKNTRIQLGYTQKDFAEKLGVIQQYVSRLESGKENISIDNLKRIADVLKRRLVIQLR